MAFLKTLVAALAIFGVANCGVILRTAPATVLNTPSKTSYIASDRLGGNFKYSVTETKGTDTVVHPAPVIVEPAPAPAVFVQPAPAVVHTAPVVPAPAPAVVHTAPIVPAPVVPAPAPAVVHTAPALPTIVHAAAPAPTFIHTSAALPTTYFHAAPTFLHAPSLPVVHAAGPETVYRTPILPAWQAAPLHLTSHSYSFGAPFVAAPALHQVNEVVEVKEAPAPEPAKEEEAKPAY